MLGKLRLRLQPSTSDNEENVCPACCNADAGRANDILGRTAVHARRPARFAEGLSRVGVLEFRPWYDIRSNSPGRPRKSNVRQRLRQSNRLQLLNSARRAGIVPSSRIRPILRLGTEADALFVDVESDIVDVVIGSS